MRYRHGEPLQFGELGCILLLARADE